MSEREEAGDARVETARSIHLTEDWAAVVVGLGLLALTLLGVIPAGLIP